MERNEARSIKGLRLPEKGDGFVLRCLLFIAAVALAIALMQPGIVSAAPDERESVPAEDSFAAVQERWGIEIVGVRRTAAEYMLNFRYRVVDPEKASVLFDRKIKPYVIDQASGAAFMVPSPPKIGQLRQTTRNSGPVAGKTYFIFFANPGKSIKAGDKVTVVIGDFRAENLTVN